MNRTRYPPGRPGFFAFRRDSRTFRVLSLAVLLFFCENIIALDVARLRYARAQAPLVLPAPSAVMPSSTVFSPPILRGIQVDPQDPFKIDFIIDSGDKASLDEEEASRLVKYFLAFLTVPEEDLWVNLSPYESDRIIPDYLGATDAGKDLLIQDYLLKQLSSVLTNPEEPSGRRFWERIYEKVHAVYGTTDFPINTFNKVWILPDEAVVYEIGNKAFVTRSRLKVMMEGDYLALKNNLRNKNLGTDILETEKVTEVHNMSSRIFSEIILPEIEKEINEGRQFTGLRQLYHSLILAAWFKLNLRRNVVNRIYADRNKIRGVDLDDRETKQKIYERYIDAYKEGTHDIIRTDYDPFKKDFVHRRYFSGGMSWGNLRRWVKTRKVAGISPVVGREMLNHIRGKLHRLSIKLKTAMGPLPAKPSLGKASGRETAGEEPDAVPSMPSTPAGPTPDPDALKSGNKPEGRARPFGVLGYSALLQILFPMARLFSLQAVLEGFFEDKIPIQLKKIDGALDARPSPLISRLLKGSRGRLKAAHRNITGEAIDQLVYSDLAPEAVNKDQINALGGRMMGWLDRLITDILTTPGLKEDQIGQALGEIERLAALLANGKDDYADALLAARQTIQTSVDRGMYVYGPDSHAVVLSGRKIKYLNKAGRFIGRALETYAPDYLLRTSYLPVRFHFDYHGRKDVRDRQRQEAKELARGLFQEWKLIEEKIREISSPCDMIFNRRFDVTVTRFDDVADNERSKMVRIEQIDGKQQIFVDPRTDAHEAVLEIRRLIQNIKKAWVFEAAQYEFGTEAAERLVHHAFSSADRRKSDLKKLLDYFTLRDREFHLQEKRHVTFYDLEVFCRKMRNAAIRRHLTPSRFELNPNVLVSMRGKAREYLPHMAALMIGMTIFGAIESAQMPLFPQAPPDPSDSPLEPHLNVIPTAVHGYQAAGFFPVLPPPNVHLSEHYYLEPGSPGNMTGTSLEEDILPTSSGDPAGPLETEVSGGETAKISPERVDPPLADPPAQTGPRIEKDMSFDEASIVRYLEPLKKFGHINDGYIRNTARILLTYYQNPDAALTTEEIKDLRIAAEALFGAVELDAGRGMVTFDYPVDGKFVSNVPYPGGGNILVTKFPERYETAWRWFRKALDDIAWKTGNFTERWDQDAAVPLDIMPGDGDAELSFPGSGLGAVPGGGNGSDGGSGDGNGNGSPPGNNVPKKGLPVPGTDNGGSAGNEGDIAEPSSPESGQAEVVRPAGQGDPSLFNMANINIKKAEVKQKSHWIPEGGRSIAGGGGVERKDKYPEAKITADAGDLVGKPLEVGIKAKPDKGALSAQLTWKAPLNWIPWPHSVGVVRDINQGYGTRGFHFGMSPPFSGGLSTSVEFSILRPHFPTVTDGYGNVYFGLIEVGYELIRDGVTVGFTWERLDGNNIGGDRLNDNRYTGAIENIPMGDVAKSGKFWVTREFEDPSLVKNIVPFMSAEKYAWQYGVELKNPFGIENFGWGGRYFTEPIGHDSQNMIEMYTKVKIPTGAGGLDPGGGGGPAARPDVRIDAAYTGHDGQGRMTVDTESGLNVGPAGFSLVGRYSSEGGEIGYTALGDNARKDFGFSLRAVTPVIGHTFRFSLNLRGDDWDRLDGNVWHLSAQMGSGGRGIFAVPVTAGVVYVPYQDAAGAYLDFPVGADLFGGNLLWRYRIAAFQGEGPGHGMAAEYRRGRWGGVFEMPVGITEGGMPYLLDQENKGHDPAGRRPISGGMDYDVNDNLRLGIRVAEDKTAGVRAEFRYPPDDAMGEARDREEQDKAREKVLAEQTDRQNEHHRTVEGSVMADIDERIRAYEVLIERLRSVEHDRTLRLMEDLERERRRLEEVRGKMEAYLASQGSRYLAGEGMLEEIMRDYLDGQMAKNRPPEDYVHLERDPAVRGRLGPMVRYEEEWGFVIGNTGFVPVTDMYAFLQDHEEIDGMPVDEDERGQLLEAMKPWMPVELAAGDPAERAQGKAVDAVDEEVPGEKEVSDEAAGREDARRAETVSADAAAGKDVKEKSGEPAGKEHEPRQPETPRPEKILPFDRKTLNRYLAVLIGKETARDGPIDQDYINYTVDVLVRTDWSRPDRPARIAFEALAVARQLHDKVPVTGDVRLTDGRIVSSPIPWKGGNQNLDGKDTSDAAIADAVEVLWEEGQLHRAPSGEGREAKKEQGEPSDKSLPVLKDQKNSPDTAALENGGTKEGSSVTSIWQKIKRIFGVLRIDAIDQNTEHSGNLQTGAAAVRKDNTGEDNKNPAIANIPKIQTPLGRWWSKFGVPIIEFISVICLAGSLSKNLRSRKKVITAEEVFLRRLSGSLRKDKKNTFDVQPSKPLVQKQFRLTGIKANYIGNKIKLILLTNSGLRKNKFVDLKEMERHILELFEQGVIGIVRKNGKSVPLQFRGLEVHSNNIIFKFQGFKEMGGSEYMHLFFRAENAGRQKFDILLKRNRFYELSDYWEERLRGQVLSLAELRNIVRRSAAYRDDPGMSFQLKNFSSNAHESYILRDLARRTIIHLEEKTAVLKNYKKALSSGQNDRRGNEESLKGLREELTSLTGESAAAAGYRKPEILQQCDECLAKLDEYLHYFKERKDLSNEVRHLASLVASIYGYRHDFLPEKDKLKISLKFLDRWVVPIDKMKRLLSGSDFWLKRYFWRLKHRSLPRFYRQSERVDTLETRILGRRRPVRALKRDRLEKEYYLFRKYIEEPPLDLSGRALSSKHKRLFRFFNNMAAMGAGLAFLFFVFGLPPAALLAAGQLLTVMTFRALIGPLWINRKINVEYRRWKDSAEVSEGDGTEGDPVLFSRNGGKPEDEFLKTLNEKLGINTSRFNPVSLFLLKGEEYSGVEVRRMNGGLEIVFVNEGFIGTYRFRKKTRERIARLLETEDVILKVGGRSIPPEKISLDISPESKIRIRVEDALGDAEGNGKATIRFRDSNQEKRYRELQLPVKVDDFQGVLNRGYKILMEKDLPQISELDDLIAGLEVFMDNYPLDFEKFKDFDTYYARLRKMASELSRFLYEKAGEAIKSEENDYHARFEYLLTLVETLNEAKGALGNFSNVDSYKSRYYPDTDKFGMKWGFPWAKLNRRLSGIKVNSDEFQLNTYKAINKYIQKLRVLKNKKASLFGESLDEAALERDLSSERRRLRRRAKELFMTYMFPPNYSGVGGYHFLNNMRMWSISISAVLVGLTLALSLYNAMALWTGMPSVGIDSLAVALVPLLKIPIVFGQSSFLVVGVLYLLLKHFLEPFNAKMKLSAEFFYYDRLVKILRNADNGRLNILQRLIASGVGLFSKMACRGMKGFFEKFNFKRAKFLSNIYSGDMPEWGISLFYMGAFFFPVLGLFGVLTMEVYAFFQEWKTNRRDRSNGISGSSGHGGISRPLKAPGPGSSNGVLSVVGEPPGVYNLRERRNNADIKATREGIPEKDQEHVAVSSGSPIMPPADRGNSGGIDWTTTEIKLRSDGKGDIRWGDIPVPDAEIQNFPGFEYDILQFHLIPNHVNFILGLDDGKRKKKSLSMLSN